MASPSNALVLKFSTDLGAAQKNLANFAANGAANLASLGAEAIKAKQTLDALSAASKFVSNNGGAIRLGIVGIGGALAAVQALHVLGAAATAAGENLDRLVKIGAAAAAAGVGTNLFQAWTGQAKALNLEVSDMVGMLTKFREASTQRIGEGGKADGVDLRTGIAGADRIKQNVLAGYLPRSAMNDFTGADSEEARLRVALGLIQQLENEGRKLAAFDLGKTFFGDTFETQLRNGEDAIGRMRAALDGLQAAGGERIVPPEEIANAQRMKAELDAINDRLAKASEPFLRDVAHWQQGILEDVIRIKSAWTDVVDVIASAWGWVEKLGKLMPNLDLGARVGNGLLGAQHGLTSGQLMDLISRGGEIGTEVNGPDMPDWMKAPALTVRGDNSRLPSLTPKAAAAPAAPKADQVETYINSLKKQTAAEEAEAKTLGLGNKAKEEAVDLAKAQEAAAVRGTPLTEAETEQVKKLADAYVDAKAKVEAYDKAQDDAKKAAEFFGQTLESAIEKAVEPGAKLQDILRDIVQSFEQASLKALILGEGPLASLFGTAPPKDAKGTNAIGGIFGAVLNFGGAHADGGTIAAGKWGIAGEADAEIINGPATVTPMAQINAALASGGRSGGAQPVHLNINVAGARGNSEIHEMVAAGVQTGMRQVHDSITRNIGPIVTNWQQRRG